MFLGETLFERLDKLEHRKLLVGLRRENESGLGRQIPAAVGTLCSGVAVGRDDFIQLRVIPRIVEFGSENFREPCPGLHCNVEWHWILGDVTFIHADGVFDYVDLVVQLAGGQQRFALHFRFARFRRDSLVLGGRSFGLPVLAVDDGELFGRLFAQFVLRMAGSECLQYAGRQSPVLNFHQSGRRIVFSHATYVGGWRYILDPEEVIRRRTIVLDEIGLLALLVNCRSQAIDDCGT